MIVAKLHVWTGRLLVSFLAVSPILAGCGTQPRAPALRDDPVYQNNQEGIRFLVPEGWKQHAKADVPPGRVTKERLLVQYKRATGSKGASLEVTLADLPEDADLASRLAGPSYGSKTWTLQPPVEDLTIRGSPAQRLVYHARVGKDETIKEVVAFRRGERAYFFIGLFSPEDPKAREQFRQAVGSTIWK